MHARRDLLRLIVTGSLAAALTGGVCPARAEDPAAFVRAAAAELVAVVNTGLPQAEKQRRLRTIIDRVADVEGVARFCLGRFWHMATPGQQKAYMALFHDVLVNNIAGKIGQYQNVKVTVGAAKQRDEGSVVSSIVERPNNPPSEVGWVIADVGGSLKVVDIIAEGTSLRLTQRSDYAAFLTRNGNNLDALLAAMKQQLAQAQR